MKRHIQQLSQTKIVKRGFIIISALVIIVGLNIKPVRAYVPQGSLQISYVNFYSMRNINPSTGTDLTNNEDWIVLDFNFDGYFSGSVDMTLTITKPVLSDPEHTAIGANAYRLSSTTTGNTSNVQQTDRWLFKFENTQHFQFIYHLESSGGIYFGGNFGTITVDVTHSEDGSSVPSVTIDYTNILTDILDYQENIYTDLDTLAQNIELIRQYSSGIADTLNTIKNNLYSLLLSNTIPYYSRNMFWFMLRMGYATDTSNTILNEEWGWYLKLGSLNSSNQAYFVKNEKYVIAFYSSTNSNSVITISRQGYDKTLTTSNVTPGVAGRRIKYIVFDWDTTTGNHYISQFTNNQYSRPLYFGKYDSMPEEVRTMLGLDSSPTLLERLVSLFTQNNQQNDEVLQSLEGINQNQQTINQSIESFNSDFNSALNDVPISETLNQLQNLNSAFTEVNNWWSLLWEKLGLFKLVIVVAMILMLIRIFTGREK